MHKRQFDLFVRHYIEALLWSEGFETDERDKLSPESVKQIRQDCSKFIAKVDKAGIKFENSLESAGHDFVLTRNGHGAGFWDGDWATQGDALTEISETFCETYVYTGDDGQLWVSNC